MCRERPLVGVADRSESEVSVSVPRPVWLAPLIEQDPLDLVLVLQGRYSRQLRACGPGQGQHGTLQTVKFCTHGTHSLERLQTPGSQAFWCPVGTWPAPELEPVSRRQLSPSGFQ